MSSQLLAGREGEGPRTIDTHTHAQTHKRVQSHTYVPPPRPAAAVFFPSYCAGPWRGRWATMAPPLAFNTLLCQFPKHVISAARSHWRGGQVRRHAALPDQLVFSLSFFVIHHDGRDIFFLPSSPFKRYLAKLFDPCWWTAAAVVVGKDRRHPEVINTGLNTGL